LDTGASISVAQSSFGQPTRPIPSLLIAGVTGNELITLVTTIQFRIAGSFYFVLVHILPTARHPLILGHNFLINSRPIIDYSKNTLSFKFVEVPFFFSVTDASQALSSPQLWRGLDICSIEVFEPPKTDSGIKVYSCKPTALLP